MFASLCFDCVVFMLATAVRYVTLTVTCYCVVWRHKGPNFCFYVSRFSLWVVHAGVFTSVLVKRLGLLCNFQSTRLYT